MAAKSESEAVAHAARARELIEEAAPLVWEAITWITAHEDGSNTPNEKEETVRRHKIVNAALGPMGTVAVKIGFEHFSASRARALKKDEAP
jgi:hypothetical protein